MRQYTKVAATPQIDSSPVYDEVDFSKIKVGLKTLDDAIVNLGYLNGNNENYGDKGYIIRAIKRKNYTELRKISDYYYEVSGIYQRACKLLAYLYRYDFVVTPYQIKENDKTNRDITGAFSAVLDYLDASNVKKLLGDIALQVIKSGCYYGYIMDFDDSFAIQQLPPEYCRSRYSMGAEPAVELNLRFFDSYFPEVQYRLKVLKGFPKEVQKAYAAYKEGKLVADKPGDENYWCLLDPALTVKFNLNGSDFPPLVDSIPTLIDLDQAQDLDRRKMMQQLLKIIIQKLPLDKNNELIFDVDEARDIHNNAVAMLQRAVGVDVLTTFADVEVANMQDSNSTLSKDDLERVERTVYNSLGISQNLFNTTGNTALEKSIANDEAMMRDLLLQFQRMLNKVIKKFNKPKYYTFKINILETTIYNYKEMSKLYKEHTQIGYDKMLPQVALGHSQSQILAAIQFQNNVLHLSDIMIPPLMSSTMSSKIIEDKKETGRPEKSNEEKSDKTLANRESLG